jgi:hypothetical protein
MNCNNCGARMSCGCQKRRASDGTQCCSTCLPFYEKGLQDKKTITPNTTHVNNNTWGSDRYTANK